MIYRLRNDLLYYRFDNNGIFSNRPIPPPGAKGEQVVTVTIRGHHFDLVNELVKKEGGLLTYEEIEAIPSCAGRAPKDIQADIHKKLREKGVELIKKGSRKDNLIKGSGNKKSGRGFIIDYIGCLDNTKASDNQSRNDAPLLTDLEIAKDHKAIAKDCFIRTMVDYNYIKKDAELSSLAINKDLIPNLKDGSELYSSLQDFVSNSIDSGNLMNYVLLSEPGTGKTYSILATIKYLFSKDMLYKNKQIVPVYYSALMLSINHASLLEYFAKQFYDANTTLARNSFRDESKYHFIIFIDAVNESTNSIDLIEEIINLSYPIYKNVSTIVATNNPDESQTLRNSDFSEISLELLDMRIVDKLPKSESLSTEFKKLLCKPFYLKWYLRSQDVTDVSDEYSAIDEYIQDCKKNGRITGTRDLKNWVSLLDKEFPKLCYNWALEQKIYFSPYEQNSDYEVLKENESIGRLVQIGVLKELSDSAYFRHENYRNYFAAKHIYNKCVDLCNIPPDAPDVLKRGLKDELTHIIDQAPLNVCVFLAPKLFHSGLLKDLVMQCKTLNNNQGFCKAIVNLFSLCTTTLDGIDFTGADLWITDLSRFDRLINCNFSKANLNPETIWLHHANISYSKSNSGRMIDDLVCLYGPEGFEIYNWKNDRQAFIRIPDELPVDSWHLAADALVIVSNEIQYCITYNEIENILHSNKEACNDVFLLSNKYATGILLDGDTLQDTPALINSNGDELEYEIGKELYISLNGKSAKSYLSSNCNYATFIDDNTVFADCDGVYIIITIEGTLLWKRMIKPVVPQLIRIEDNYALIRMVIPGAALPKYFKYDLSKHKSQLISNSEDKTCDCDSNISNETVSNTLEFFDTNHKKHTVYGGAIEFTGSLFSNKTTVVFRPIDENERKIFEQYGGKVYQ